MLSETQKTEIITRALSAFHRQFGIKRDISDMTLSIDKPNAKAMCSIFIASKTDHFRIKLNLLCMDVAASMTAYRETQLQGYGPGMDDEVLVADLKLPKREYVAFYNYLKSPKFLAEVVDDLDCVIDEDNVMILSEEGFTIVLEDEGV